MKTLCVIFGGISPENEVSIITALQAMRTAEQTFHVIAVYVDQNGIWYTGNELKNISFYKNIEEGKAGLAEVTLRNRDSKHYLVSRPGLFSQKIRFDYLLPCFHGGLGEGGYIQSICEFYNIPLLSSGTTGAAIGMDKVLMKHSFQAAGLKQANYSWITRQAWQNKKESVLADIKRHHKLPLFVKPSRGGSSIGTVKVSTHAKLHQALDLAASLDSRIVIEDGIENAREINVSILGNAGDNLMASVCEEVVHEPGKDFLDFTEKYLASGKSQGMASTKRIIPAKIDQKLALKIAELGKQIFNLLDCSGLVRIDFLVKGEDIYVIEINTIPGSLSFYLWEKSGLSYQELIIKLASLAQEKSNENRRTIKEFPSKILSNFESAPGAKNKLRNS